MQGLEEARNLIFKNANSIGIKKYKKKGASYQVEGLWNDGHFHGNIGEALGGTQGRGWFRFSVHPTEFKFGGEEGKEWEKAYYNNLAEILKKSGVKQFRSSPSSYLGEFEFLLPSRTK